MILLIDNYDSFSYNLYQYIGEIEPDIKVIRNDELTVDESETSALLFLLLQATDKTRTLAKQTVKSKAEKLLSNFLFIIIPPIILFLNTFYHLLYNKSRKYKNNKVSK